MCMNLNIAYVCLWQCYFVLQKQPFQDLQALLPIFAAVLFFRDISTDNITERHNVGSVDLGEYEISKENMFLIGLLCLDL